MFDVPECQQIQIRKPENTCVYVCRKNIVCEQVRGNPAANSKAVEGSKPALEQKKNLHVLFVQTCQKTIADSSTSLAIVGCQER